MRPGIHPSYSLGKKRWKVVSVKLGVRSTLGVSTQYTFADHNLVPSCIITVFITIIIITIERILLHPLRHTVLTMHNHICIVAITVQYLTAFTLFAHFQTALVWCERALCFPADIIRTHNCKHTHEKYWSRLHRYIFSPVFSRVCTCALPVLCCLAWIGAIIQSWQYYTLPYIIL